MRQTLYFIRHGRTVGNERHLYYGATDLELSQNGIEELRRMKGNAGYPSPAACDVYVSGLRRTRDSLEILFPGTEAQSEPLLNEMNFGEFEMHTHEELAERPEYITWITGDFMNNPCPGGETGTQQVERNLRAIDNILRKTDRDVLLVCHFGNISAVLQDAFPNDFPTRVSCNVDNGFGYAVVYEEKRPISYYKIPYQTE